MAEPDEARMVCYEHDDGPVMWAGRQRSCWMPGCTNPGVLYQKNRQKPRAEEQSVRDV